MRSSRNRNGKGLSNRLCLRWWTTAAAADDGDVDVTEIIVMMIDLRTHAHARHAKNTQLN